MKTVKTNIYSSLVIGLASFIALSVFLLSLHAKDLVRYGDLAYARTTEYRDLSEKASGELHDHVDKQVLKAFGKTAGDGFTLSRGRDDTFTADTEEDPGLFVRIHEQFLMFRVFASLPFAIS